MLKHMLGIAAVSIAAVSSTAAFAQEAVRIGASGSGSVFYTLGAGLSRVVQEHGGLNATVESVGGSHANIFALQNDQVDLAIVNGLAAIDGFRGREPFPARVDLCLVAQGHPSLRQVFVRRGAGISEPADLAGKTWITAMPANPDIAEISDALIKTAGIDDSSITKVQMAETAEAVSGFEAGTIDAATMPASAGAPHITRLFDAGTIDYLYLKPETVSALEPNLPEGLSPTEVPADTYPNQKQPAMAFAVRTYLVANCDLPEDTVRKVASALFEHPDAFAQYHESAKEWTLENTLERPALPFHPGVVSYFQDRGVWTDDLAKRQASF